MRVTQANLEDLKQALEELVTAKDEMESDLDLWLEAREDRSAYDREEVADARATIEGAIPELTTYAEELLAVLRR